MKKERFEIVTTMTRTNRGNKIITDTLKTEFYGTVKEAVKYTSGLVRSLRAGRAIVIFSSVYMLREDWKEYSNPYQYIFQYTGEGNYY